MYDPTIFDNLKIVVEGGLYDLERDNRLQIRDRHDRIDLASMGRTFNMSCLLPDADNLLMEVELASELTDFAAELARMRIVEPSPPGCQITIRYRFDPWTEDAVAKTLRMTRLVQESWSEDLEIHHTVETTIQQTSRQTSLTTSVRFLRKIDERHIDGLEAMLEHAIVTGQRMKREISR